MKMIYVLLIIGFIEFRRKYAAVRTNDVIIGIDIGTTYSYIGIYKDSTVKIIPIVEGDLFCVKRLIGRDFNDSSVQQYLEKFPFKVVEINSRPAVQMNVDNEEKFLMPEEVLSIIFDKIRKTAELYLEQNVTYALVTVPTYFNDRQRQAIKNAANVSGLDVIRMTNEPYAVATSYEFHKSMKETNIIMFHLGGGTFDVTLLSIDNGVFEVYEASSDKLLGGKDFNQRIIDYYVNLFKDRTGDDVRNDKQFIQKLECEVEKAKRILSSENEAKIEIEYFFENETLTRAKFEELNMDLLQSTIPILQNLLNEANWTKADVADIVLVGGSTRIPKIRELIKDFFDGKEPRCDFEPDEVVAYGAAIHGDRLLHDDYVYVSGIDMNQLTFGIETVGGVMTKVVPQYTFSPFKKSRIFSTATDNQSTVTIKVFEGERPMTKDNHFLGKFDLTGIAPMARGVSQIEVTFEVDIDTILTITAEDKSTGNKNSMIIQPSTNILLPEEIDRMIEDGKKFFDEDEKLRESLRAKSQLESYIYSLKVHLADENRFAYRFSKDKKEKIERTLIEQIQWLELNQNADAEQFFRLKAHLENLAQWPIILMEREAISYEISSRSPSKFVHDTL